MSKSKDLINYLESIESKLTDITANAGNCMFRYFHKKTHEEPGIIYTKRVMCFIFSPGDIQYIQDLFTHTNLKTFVEALKPFQLQFKIPSRYTDAGKSKKAELQFDIDPDQMTVKVLRPDIANIPWDQHKYIDEFEYTVSLAYKLTAMRDLFERIRNILKPILSSYALYNTDRQAELSHLKADIDAKLDQLSFDPDVFDALYKELQKFKKNKTSSIEYLLDQAYNQHVQGQVLARDWQKSNIIEIVKSIDNAYYMSYRPFPLSSLYWPCLKFSEESSEGNRLQKCLQTMMRILNENMLQDAVDEEKANRTDVKFSNNAEFKRTLHHAQNEKMGQIDVIRNNLYEDCKSLKAIDQTLAREEKSPSPMNSKENAFLKKKRHYLESSKLAYNVLVSLIQLNKKEALITQSDAINILYEHLDASIKMFNSNTVTFEDDFERKSLVNLSKALKAIKNEPCIAPVPTFLDRLLALINKILPYFTDRVNTCKKYDILQESSIRLSTIAHTLMPQPN